MVPKGLSGEIPECRARQIPGIVHKQTNTQKKKRKQKNPVIKEVSIQQLKAESDRIFESNLKFHNGIQKKLKILGVREISWR